MELAAIRNNKQREALLDHLKGYRLPFKIAIQEVHPNRSLDANAYYWGVVIKMIADAMGEVPARVHNEFKKMFLLEYAPDKNNKWSTRVRSTTELGDQEYMLYVLKVRTTAMIHLGIDIPLPNEVILNDEKV